jgi:hypothetical protein
MKTRLYSTVTLKKKNRMTLKFELPIKIIFSKDTTPNPDLQKKRKFNKFSKKNEKK